MHRTTRLILDYGLAQICEQIVEMTKHRVENYQKIACNCGADFSDFTRLLFHAFYLYLVNGLCDAIGKKSAHRHIGPSDGESITIKPHHTELIACTTNKLCAISGVRRWLWTRAQSIHTNKVPIKPTIALCKAHIPFAVVNPNSDP